MQLQQMKSGGSPSSSAGSGLLQRQAATSSLKESAAAAQQGNAKLIVGQSDPAGVRLWMASSSLGDESGVIFNAQRVSVSSNGSGYSLRPSLRVSQQLEGLENMGYDLPSF